MIDFKNGSFIKLKSINNADGHAAVKELLIGGEEIVASYATIRDKVIFTNKRVISINVQGLTGSKIDYTSLPYKKLHAFSVETAGTFDLDAEIDLYLSEIGLVRFELKGSEKIKELCKLMAEYVL